MTKMSLATARAFANEASRGGLTALGNLLRAIVNDEVSDHPVAGTGVTSATGFVYKSSVSRPGDVIVTEILVDVTGLQSADTDLDVMGVEDTAHPCHIGQITAAINGTTLRGTMQCLENFARMTHVGIY